MWVMQREQQSKPVVTTWTDLQMHLLGHNVGDIWSDDNGLDDIPLSQLCAGMDRTTHLTDANLKLKEGIEKARKKRKTESGIDDDLCRPDEEWDDVRALFMAKYKSAREDSRVIMKQKERLIDDINATFDRLWDDVNVMYPIIEDENNKKDNSQIEDDSNKADCSIEMEENAIDETNMDCKFLESNDTDIRNKEFHLYEKNGSGHSPVRHTQYGGCRM